ncbi:hypothetical protein FZ103_11685 [Streptomonospora sp. PA3]|uniref:hypothetical protein n=1 Tax=Streptomonospora sp. PA3 TaxID=2607326 RepID=UPI0012DCDA76|nr:hypothetical protein [Streptomonospora sp. PA3]MUL41827.1 hypothetical protein [Streptomonospora sp. PA3]
MENEKPDVAVDAVRNTLRRLPLEFTDSQWVGRVGDLVVADGDRVKLNTPANWRDGGFRYPAPPGAHPVYAAAHDSGEPGAPRFLVTHVFLPFAPWEQVAEAHWKRFNDGVGSPIEDCACLWTDRSEDAALGLWKDSGSDSIPWIEEAVGSDEVLARPGNYPQAIADAGSGVNVLGFPVVVQGFVEGYTARNDAGDLLALILWAEEN